MILLINEEIKFYKRQKVCGSFKKGFSYDKNKESELSLDYTKNSEIFVITPENLEELLIIFAI